MMVIVSSKLMASAAVVAVAVAAVKFAVAEECQ
jgi:hypothetical protein